MSKFELESTVTKLVTVAFIFYLFIFHAVISGGIDNKSELLAKS